MKGAITTSISANPIYLILILFVPNISSNTFAAYKREFKVIPRFVTHMALLKHLQNGKLQSRGIVDKLDMYLKHVDQNICKTQDNEDSNK